MVTCNYLVLKLMPDKKKKHSLAFSEENGIGKY